MFYSQCFGQKPKVSLKRPFFYEIRNVILRFRLFIACSIHGSGSIYVSPNKLVCTVVGGTWIYAALLTNGSSVATSYKLL